MNQSRTIAIVLISCFLGAQSRKLMDKESIDCQKIHMNQGGTVCGTDDVTYQNEGLAWCQGVEVKSVGPCAGHDPMSDYTFDTLADVTMEELERFKDEKFVFVAKRKFEAYAREDFKNETRSPMSNRNDNIDGTIIYAHRITDSGDEYLAKYDVSELSGLVKKHVRPHLPLADEQEENYPRRQLNEGNRGIVGPDSRYKICLSESCYPYSTIGEFDSPSRMGGCTGTVISPSSVLTAAHCFYKNGHYTDINSFAPGRYRKYPTARGGSHSHKGQVKNPYGVWKVQFKTIFDGWVSTGNIRYDMAIAHFFPTLYRHEDYNANLNIGELTGYVGLRIVSNDSTRLQKATVTGYPYDKPAGEMWTSGPCMFQAGYEPVITYHNCDSVRGNDGSALLDIDKAIAYGVNVADVPVGPHYPDQAFTNLGVVFNDASLALIKGVAGLYK